MLRIRVLGTRCTKNRLLVLHEIIYFTTTRTLFSCLQTNLKQHGVLNSAKAVLLLRYFRMLSEFCSSLSKVITLWHCVKVKQHYLY